MKDITPYTEVEAANLGSYLAKAGVPCPSPLAQKDLLCVIKGLNILLNRKDLPEIGRELLGGYRDRILDVVQVTVGQSRVVIDRLESLVHATQGSSPVTDNPGEQSFYNRAEKGTW